MNKMPLTDLDRRAATALARCTFLPSSTDKRMARFVQAATELTDRQLAYLWRLIWRYRRQHQDRELINTAVIGLGLRALIKWMRGPQGVPPGSFVEYAPRSVDARRQADLDKLARWEAG